METKNEAEQLEQLLTRRVAKILPSKDGLEKLMKKRKIRLYQGFDPTGSRLHLGHSIGLRKLMEFVNLGHEVIFLFGTGTVLAGDPSQRDSARKLINQEDIEENIKEWKKQASAIVDFSKATIKQNGDWLIPLTLKDIIKIGSNISAAQLFKREMFQRRIERGDTVWYHETLYPLLQGYDSVVLDVDLEIGGTDQEFNMLIGRDLQQKMNHKEKYVLTTPMIMGTDGKQMSKTSGNCIWLDDTATDMFGKIMSMPDENIVSYMELVTNLPAEMVEQTKSGLLQKTINPKDAKENLAKEIVKDFYGKAEAERVAKEFTRVFKERQVPSDMEVYIFPKKPIKNIVEILIGTKMVTSKSNAWRLVRGDGKKGGVKYDNKDIGNPKELILNDGVLQVGQRHFVKVRFE